MRNDRKGSPARKRRANPGGLTAASRNVDEVAEVANAADAAEFDEIAEFDDVDEAAGIFVGEVETDEGDGTRKRRKIRGLSGNSLRNAQAILKDEGVRPVDDDLIEFKVKSQSSSLYYSVVYDETVPLMLCNCPANRRLKLQGIENPFCKHVKAVEFWLAREFGDAEDTSGKRRVSATSSQRSVHVKKHPLYNKIRKSYNLIVPHLIRCLVGTLLPEEVPRRRFPNGRLPKSAPSLFANLLLAASSKKGGREAVNDMVLAAFGMAGSSMSFTTRLGHMGDVAVRDCLRRLLERTALAVGLATNYACDATHFRTPYSEVTFEIRRGKRVAVIRAKRLKAHVGICTDTQIIFSLYTTNPHVSEANYFDVHVDDAWRLWGRVDTWHADHSYHSKENLNRIHALGGDPSYIEFADDDKPNGDPIWDWSLAQAKKRDRNGNHPRSLVESVNHVLRSHSREVRAKGEIQRECELLARAIVYNLRRLIYLGVVNGLKIPFADETTRALVADVALDKRRKRSA